MKVLHVLRSEPDQTTEKLMAPWAEANETQRFELYQEDPDYDRLIELVFASDKVICWW